MRYLKRFPKEYQKEEAEKKKNKKQYKYRRNFILEKDTEKPYTQSDHKKRKNKTCLQLSGKDC